MSEAVPLLSLFAFIAWTAAALDLIFEKFKPERSLARTGTSYTTVIRKECRLPVPHPTVHPVNVYSVRKFVIHTVRMLTLHILTKKIH